MSNFIDFLLVISKIQSPIPPLPPDRSSQRSIFLNGRYIEGASKD